MGIGSQQRRAKPKVTWQTGPTYWVLRRDMENGCYARTADAASSSSRIVTRLS